MNWINYQLTNLPEIPLIDQILHNSGQQIVLQTHLHATIELIVSYIVYKVLKVFHARKCTNPHVLLVLPVLSKINNN